MFLITGMVQYDMNMLPMLKQDHYLYVVAIYFVPYSRLHQASLWLVSLILTASPKQAPTLFEPTLILPTTLNHRHGSNPITLFSAPENLPVLFPPQQSPLFQDALLQ